MVKVLNTVISDVNLIRKWKWLIPQKKTFQFFTFFQMNIQTKCFIDGNKIIE